MALDETPATQAARERALQWAEPGCWLLRGSFLVTIEQGVGIALRHKRIERRKTWMR